MEQKLFEGGWESYPKRWVAGVNTLNFVTWIIAFLGVYPLKFLGVPWVSLLYALIIFIGLILKKHNCFTCWYYNKWCCSGWGKWAALFFGKNSGDRKTGMKLTIIYPILMILPIICMISILIFEFGWLELFYLIAFTTLSLPVGMLVRMRGCEHCKLRYTCPGSAAKG